MRNSFLKPALIFTILVCVTGWLFSKLVFLSFQDAEDLYDENFDIIEHEDGGRITAEIYWTLGAFGYETTTTKKNGATTSTSTDYYYTIPAFDKNGETYYIAIEIDEDERSLFKKIENDTWGYIEGTITEWTDNIYAFEGTIDELDEEFYDYMLEYFREFELYEDEADLRAHVLPLCLTTMNFDIAPVYIVIFVILLALAVLFWILFFKRRGKMKAQGNAYVANGMAAGAAMSGATLNGVPISNVPQQNADSYNGAYNQYNTGYNTQYSNGQYNTPQPTAGYDSIIINGVSYPRAALEQVNSYVMTGEVIKAIKEFRDISGAELAVAKNVIDNWHQYYR